MSEVEKHYATGSTGRPRQGGPGPRPLPSGDDSIADKAARAVRESAQGAASWSRETYGDATEWVSDGVESVSRNATYAKRRSAAEFNRGRRTVESFVEENPIMVGVVGLAAGLLIGALIPGTRRENQYLGRYADEIRDQGMRYAQGVAEQGRHFVDENLGRLSQGRVDRDTGDETTADR